MRYRTRMHSSRWLTLLALITAQAACTGSHPTDAGDAATDAADVAIDEGDAGEDVVLPPGPRGQILGIPQTANESWAIPTLRAPVQVVRTEANVPHIYAASERDATAVWGFVTARDRYTQIELARRLGLGIISKLLGEAGLAADQGARDRGYAYVADRVLARMSASELDLLDAYAEGVNAYIDQVRRQALPVPTELGPVGLLVGQLRPAMLMEHLTRRDLAAVLAVVLFNSSYADDDLNRARVAATFPTLFNGLPDETLRHDGAVHDIFERVAPITNITSAAGFGVEGGTLMARARTRRAPSNRNRERSAPHVPEDVLDRAIASNEFFTRLRRGMRDADFGSNAWATGGAANADGHTIVSGDGHLPLSVPTLLHQVGIDTSVFGDGTDPQTFLGLAFPGIPLLPLGTNGEVAYSFTYLYGDLTDWYAEEIQLDASGRPSASRFNGTWHPLVATQETYDIANVPSLNSVGRTEMWAHWTTFDGRWIASIEGRPATRMTTPGAGEAVIEIQGNLVIPADVDGDGHISAVSFDYTGFDVSDVPMGLRQFSRAHNVGEIHTAQRRFVGFAQNFIAGDRAGNIYYSGYTATPCRSALTRTGTGASTAWAAGADPRLLLDGTRFGGFTIPVDANGLPDEAAGTADPSQCLVPYDQWPTAINPARGYVLTANNDIGGNSLDNNLANDTHYVGGSWDVGYRARTISETLARHTMAHTSSIDAMAALQADHHSSLALELIPFLFEAIDAGHTLAQAGGTPSDPADQRLLALYNSEHAAIDEVRTRLAAWQTRGAISASGVETFYDSPTADDRNDAVAAMLFNAWYRTFERSVFDDEHVDTIFALDPRFLRATAMLGIVQGRGASNPRMLASWNAATQESVFFDDATTASVVETSREDALHALVAALTTLRAAPTAPGIGGFGSTDMNQYLWGLRHMVAFPSLIDAYASGVMGVDFITNQMKISPARLPLAMNLPATDPRANLPWFPRPGDYFGVDASNPPSTGDDYIYRNGPVMRMVIELQGNGHVRGQNVIPGGQSGVASSPNFDDQARLWLGNRALPMRFDVDSVVAGATGREVYHP